MKTSKKLMIGFAGILVLLMLFSATLLRVNYSKGITNEKQYNATPDTIDLHIQEDALAPFQVVVFKNGQDDLATEKVLTRGDGATYTEQITQRVNNVNIQHGEKFELVHNDSISKRQSGDTLFVTLIKQGDITLICPSLKAIQNNYCNISLSEFNLPQLQITAGAKTEVHLTNNQIKSLTYSGEKENSLSLNSKNTLDSLKITMGKNGTLRMEDITYKVADIKVDSLKALEVYGGTISSIKQIH